MTTQTTVVGLGATGLSVARYLHRVGESFSVVDNFGKPEQVAALQEISPEADLTIGAFDSALLSPVKTLVVNPGISIKTPAIKKAQQQGSEVIGDIELFARAVPAQSKLAAVTGSNGKSTCVTLLYEMAKQADWKVKLGGNIGTPALDLLTDEAVDLFVLELSSYQLETTSSLDCDVACVLNLSPDHLDRYDNYQGYIQAKKRLLNQTKTVVVFADDSEIATWDYEVAVTTFSLLPPVDASAFGVVEKAGRTWLSKGDALLFPLDEMALTGLHNAANALAALAMGDTIGLPMEAMLATLRSFSGLKHRMQKIAEIADVIWVNDSKATNVGATVAALHGLLGEKKNIILLAGGQTKGADLLPLQNAMTPVKQVLLFGEDAPLLYDTLHSFVQCTLVDDLAAACKQAKQLSQPGDIVLLSPAGASFDQFENFEARGDAFIDWVKQSMEVPGV